MTPEDGNKREHDPAGPWAECTHRRGLRGTESVLAFVHSFLSISLGLRLCVTSYPLYLYPSFGGRDATNVEHLSGRAAGSTGGERLILISQIRTGILDSDGDDAAGVQRAVSCPSYVLICNVDFLKHRLSSLANIRGPRARTAASIPRPTALGICWPSRTHPSLPPPWRAQTAPIRPSSGPARRRRRR